MRIEGARVIEAIEERQQRRGGRVEARFEVAPGDRVVALVYGDEVRMPIEKAAGIVRELVALDGMVALGDPVWRVDRGGPYVEIEAEVGDG